LKKSFLNLGTSNALAWSYSAEQIAPLLNDAKEPDDITLKIEAIVDKEYNVAFVVFPSQDNPSTTKLQVLLKNKFADAMTKALKLAKLSITDNIM
jgi:hypothetical protein